MAQKLNSMRLLDANRIVYEVKTYDPNSLTHKHWDVYLDQTAAIHEQICVSGGQRGVNLRIPVKGLMQVFAVKMVKASTDT